VLLKLFIYGYLNRIPSSRRLEPEAGRNVEVMWLTGKLVPESLRAVRRALPPDRRAEGRLRRHRRQQVQSREQPPLPI
jgi:transposase